MNMVLRRPIIVFLLLALAMTSIAIAQDERSSTQDAAAADARETPSQDNSDLRSQLLGVWLLAGEPGTTDEPSSGARLKFFGRSHWAVTQSDPDSGVVLYHHGGTYTLDGNQLATTVTFADETHVNMIGMTYRFEISIKGDTYTQIGQANPWSEAWRRDAE